MRRVITFALVVATYLCGSREHLRRPSLGRAPGTAAVHLTAQAGRPGFKVVRFAGYTIRVPASWPVYRLDRDPSRCVRYDRHAVYLGQPGANQQCPAHLVGRTATISIQAAAPGPGGQRSSRGRSRGHRGRDRDLAAGRRVGDPQCPGPGDGHLARGSGRIGHRDLHRGRRAGCWPSCAACGVGAATSPRRPAPAPGRGRGQVMTGGRRPWSPAPGWPRRPARRGDPGTASAAGAAVTLRTTHPGQHRHPRAHRARRHRQARKHPGSQHKTSRHKAASTRPQARGQPPPGPQAPGPQAPGPPPPGPPPPGPQAPGPPPPGPQAPGPQAPGPRHHHARKHQRARHRGPSPHSPPPPVARHGFDSCTTPSLAAMRAWRRAFSARAVYIGGVEAGCASPNLTAGWVRAVTGMGWALMPTYVGRQASCSSVLGPDPARPRRGPGPGRGPRRDPPGRRAGDGPRHPGLLRHGGLPRAPPLPGRHPGLPGRLDQDAARPRLPSGVYSSASSGAENLGWAHPVNGHRIAKPDSMWFGLWDNEQNVRGLPYLLQELVAGAAPDQAVRGPAPAHRGRVHTGHRLGLGLRGCLPVIGWARCARPWGCGAPARRPPAGWSPDGPP